MGPLKGLQIIEMAGIGPAPFCGMVLSDLGANVIRVDRVTAAGSERTIPQKGAGPIPAISIICKPFRGPIKIPYKLRIPRKKVTSKCFQIR
jgi:alpha-methylacyl-CoA racemase